MGIVNRRSKCTVLFFKNGRPSMGNQFVVDMGGDRLGVRWHIMNRQATVMTITS